MYIHMTEGSKTHFMGPMAICIYICVDNKKKCHLASLIVVSCHNIIMLSKQAIVEKRLGFPILF